MKVLLSAYACEPGKGSEPGVGWNWVQQIARSHQVWVMTRANNRLPIENALEKAPMPNVHWVYFDLPRWMWFWKKGRRGIHAYYWSWQIGAYLIARKLHGKIGFDLAHHVTFVNYWMPTFLALLPVPFVWGPVGGGESSPRAFSSAYSLRGKTYEMLRGLARSLGELDPFVRLTARRATFALATTGATESRLRALGCRIVLKFSQVALTSDEICSLAALPLHEGNPFRLVSIGNLLHWKGFELALKSFHSLQRRFPACEYWLIGEGPERKRLECLARKLAVSDKVTFWGCLRRSEVLEKLAECDVLVHPSLHDSGGGVCLEAMAGGRPVICLDLGGPGFQVTEEAGIKVPGISPEQVVHDLATALCQIASDPVRRARLGQAGRKRVEQHFTWNNKGEWMTQLYCAAAGVHSPQVEQLQP